MPWLGGVLEAHREVQLTRSDARGQVVGSLVDGDLDVRVLDAPRVLGANARGFSSGTGLIAFWGMAAVVAGPLLGRGAYWVKTDRSRLAAIGIGAMSGVLVGESVYGLTRIADTTYAPYWWGEAAVGVALLAWVAAPRLERLQPVALAVAAAALTAAAFVVVYGLDLIAVLP